MPYLGEQHLYDSFNHDEPWDSPTNIALLSRMPEFFKSHGGLAEELPPGMTLIQRPVGNGAFPLPGSTEDAERISFDGLNTSQTIWLVETNPELAVEWTRPADFEYDPNDPFSGLGETRRGATIHSMVDGSVDTDIDKMSVSPIRLKSMFTLDPEDDNP